MKNAASHPAKIETILKGATYQVGPDTELTAPGYYLDRGDCARRWVVKSEKTHKPIALWVVN